MKIIIDAMGGDHAPLEIVKGAIQAYKDFGVEIVLTGKEEEIRKAVDACGEPLPETRPAYPDEARSYAVTAEQLRLRWEKQ